MAIILAAIPLFFLLIAIELFVDRKRGTGFYQFNDAINSLQVGILSRVTGILKALLPFSIYYYCYENFRLYSFDEQSYLLWGIAFVLYDLAYYWVHRLSHRINVMWGSHVVHHSSEEYNLTTALRQSSTPALFGWLIYMPLALIGVSPMMLLVCGSLNLIYQFWVHTRHIDKMPNWFERIFVTPSHHRVHHALNRDYIDKNFAGVFILWDKLFGSFQAEKTTVKTVYGISTQLKSWNPVWANFQVYWSLLKDSFYARNWLDKVKVWVMPPGWRPKDAAEKEPQKYATTKTMVKYDVTLSLHQKLYVLTQHVFIICLTLWLLLSVGQLLLADKIWLSCFGIFSLFSLGNYQQQGAHCRLFESIRVLASAMIVTYFISQQFWLEATFLAIVYVFYSLYALHQINNKNNKTAQTVE